MPLFKCSKCGAVENTALGAYWAQKCRGEPVLCSECDTGTWHGQFPKESAEGYVEDEQGHLYRPEEVAPGGYFYGRVKLKKGKKT